MYPSIENWRERESIFMNSCCLIYSAWDRQHMKENPGLGDGGVCFSAWGDFAAAITSHSLPPLKRRKPSQEWKEGQQSLRGKPG